MLQKNNEIIWSKKYIEVILFLVLLLFGLIWIIFVPPFQKPDENTHYFRSVTIVDKQFVCFPKQETDGLRISRRYINFASELGVDRMAANYDQKISMKDILFVDKKIGDSDYEKISLGSQFCVLNAFPYLIFILPLLVGNLFNSLLLGFFLSRLFAFLIFFFSILWSYNKIRASRLSLVIIFYAFTPMVLHQATAIGYDYLSLAMIPMIFALNIAFDIEKKFKKRDLYLFILLMTIFLCAKSGYYFVSLAYFLIPWRKISKNFLKYIFFTIITFSLFISISLFITKIYSPGLFSPLENGPNPILQFEYLKTPSHIIILIENTILRYGSYYIHSFIGSFGWLEYSFLPFFYTFYSIAFGCLIVYISRDRYFNKCIINIVKIFTLLFSSILFIFVSFYLFVNEVGLSFVYAIQGRYFLVFLPYLAILYAGVFRLLIENKYFRFIGVTFILLFILFEMLYAIFNRFYIM